MSTPNAADPSEPKSRRGLVISFLVVLAMVLGGFVGAQIAQSGDDSSTTDSTEVPSTVVDEVDTGNSDVTTAPIGDAPGSSNEPVATAPSLNGAEPAMNVAEVLKRFDTNGDGFFDENELINTFKILKIDFSADDLK